MQNSNSSSQPTTACVEWGLASRDCCANKKGRTASHAPPPPPHPTTTTTTVAIALQSGDHKRRKKQATRAAVSATRLGGAVRRARRCRLSPPSWRFLSTPTHSLYFIHQVTKVLLVVSSFESHPLQHAHFAGFHRRNSASQCLPCLVPPSVIVPWKHHTTDPPRVARAPPQSSALVRPWTTTVIPIPAIFPVPSLFDKATVGCDPVRTRAQRGIKRRRLLAFCRDCGRVFSEDWDCSCRFSRSRERCGGDTIALHTRHDAWKVFSL